MNTAKSAIVTGGERGIGKAIVGLLETKGFHVSVLGLDLELAKELPPSVDFIQCDVSQFDAVEKAIDNICSKTSRLDALICNAGIADPGTKEIDFCSPEDWKRVIEVNLGGPFYCAKAATPYLRQAKGSIVNIASIRGIRSEANTFAYTASKGGLISLTHSLAASLGPSIRVNSVSPGWILTGDDYTPTPEDHSQHWSGRVGKAEDVAQMVAYLVSDKAEFITGQDFVVDGGVSKKLSYV
ncbi:SDR family oxidoreductase [Pelagicoccus mobilis]|uniref:SDR family oxidoreductase n=1 Tax=Pelagicoccus mobilis TaxID=415221 RepID=A0A934VN71_9BACT|nr:SDR family oxidoreductase [Pelagicoccus mobilis]MBK1879621.1 SDR family oxidoreductase [Pelagicoccus mobilis]